MKATAIAPANIAFIKYWGKADDARRLPLNPSISMNLSACITTTTVEFSPDFEKDTVSEGFDEKRILTHIDRIRRIAKINMCSKITTKNSFPASAGIASSASGFAALTVAAAAALGLKLGELELSVLARLGSGSACRSIPDGFVKWEDSYAYSLYPPSYWDLRDILLIIENNVKDVSSSAGHEGAYTSPFFTKRLQEVPKRISRLEAALAKKDFQKLGEVIEEDCLDVHHVMQTQSPPLFYWNEKTRQVIRAIKKSGLPVYFTIDAGPNVHLICEAKDEKQVIDIFGNTYQIIVNKPSRGARLC
jgi:diphosphomevalonate decarboxylase